MAYIQIKNVPERIHRQLKRYAEDRGTTIRDVVLSAVNRELLRDQLFQRWEGRSSVDLGRRAADSLDEARKERDVKRR